MNKQGVQIAIDAIYKVINSAPKTYSSNIYSYTPNYVEGNISVQQFMNWINYLYNILDISYQNLGLYDFIMVKNNIIQIVRQSDPNNSYAQYKMPYSMLINRINNELLGFIQHLLQY